MFLGSPKLLSGSISTTESADAARLDRSEMFGAAPSRGKRKHGGDHSWALRPRETSNQSFRSFRHVSRSRPSMDRAGRGNPAIGSTAGRAKLPKTRPVWRPLPLRARWTTFGCQNVEALAISDVHVDYGANAA
jgi:hypothetical protein